MATETSAATDRKKDPGTSTVRTIDLLLRLAHIFVMSILLGGVFWGVPFSRLMQWHLLTIVTGFLLVALGIYKCRHWFYQGDGVMAEIHVALLALIHFQKEHMVPVLFAVLVFGVVGSHMPARMRHYSFVHKRRID